MSLVTLFGALSAYPNSKSTPEKFKAPKGSKADPGQGEGGELIECSLWDGVLDLEVLDLSGSDEGHQFYEDWCEERIVCTIWGGAEPACLTREGAAALCSSLLDNGDAEFDAASLFVPVSIPPVTSPSPATSPSPTPREPEVLLGSPGRPKRASASRLLASNDSADSVEDQVSNAHQAKLTRRKALCGGVIFVPTSYTRARFQRRFLTYCEGISNGTALGVIFLEGIESLADAHASDKLPTSQIALALIVGFTFMTAVEQLVAPHSHSHNGPPGANDLSLHAVGGAHARSTVEFDAEMGDMEQPDAPSGGGFIQVDMAASLEEIKGSRARAYPLTFGLFMHGLADGLALGVSSLSDPGTDPTHRDLSFIVFLALIIHKAPTSLALSTSLLNTSLPRPECRKHLAFFAASTPFGAIVSYVLISFFSAGAQGSWTGLALLVSGGTFLYVATVLQTVSHAPDDPAAGDMKPTVRVLLIAAGMILPYIISHIVLPEVH
ncbi:ZIP zinc transporter-domain-containing protein [Mycena galericulata]|nr:ZIP zinc transporter-domain-containing protein [Mycena galericulata]